MNSFIIANLDARTPCRLRVHRDRPSSLAVEDLERRMENYFVPYFGKRPASLCINGHRLVILAHDKEVLADDLELLGADRLKTVKHKDRDGVQEEFLGKIARQVDGGVVIAPSGVELREVIKNLESELPWLQ